MGHAGHDMSDLYDKVKEDVGFRNGKWAEVDYFRMADDPDTGSSRLETDAVAGRWRRPPHGIRGVQSNKPPIHSSFDSDHSGTKMVQ